MLSECILLFSNGFHNSQRVFIIHPNDENLFERKQRYDIILSIECILLFFEWISQFTACLHNPDENLFERKQRYD